eukprot:TRINITY_DN11138_c0_g1_i1.p1 TRINITY_DN11138_c0_g1~~TRINITY_DN11138_c0_g1_i1.p1  ORF type:complete len:574 (-),score=98.42 TRINITY_DN11138_c0_g1_i1:155-1876(-)
MQTEVQITRSARRRASGSIPTSRYLSTFTAVGDVVFLYGGSNDGKVLNDVHILDTDTLSWRSPMVAARAELPPLYGHTCVLLGKQLFIFGGQGASGVPSSESYKLNTETKEFIHFYGHADARPCARTGHSATVVGSTKMYVFGGKDRDGRYLEDMFVFDNEHSRWSEVIQNGPVPSARAWHTAVAAGTKIFLFGGFCDSIGLRDLAIFDTELKTWSIPKVYGDVPPALYSHVMVALSPHHIVVGGGHASAASGEWFLLDIASMRWSRLQMPTASSQPGRFGHAAAIVRGSLFSFGGRNHLAVNDLYHMQFGVSETILSKNAAMISPRNDSVESALTPLRPFMQRSAWFPVGDSEVLDYDNWVLQQYINIHVTPPQSRHTAIIREAAARRYELFGEQQPYMEPGSAAYLRNMTPRKPQYHQQQQQAESLYLASDEDERLSSPGSNSSPSMSSAAAESDQSFDSVTSVPHHHHHQQQQHISNAPAQQHVTTHVSIDIPQPQQSHYSKSPQQRSRKQMRKAQRRARQYEEEEEQIYAPSWWSYAAVALGAFAIGLIAGSRYLGSSPTSNSSNGNSR